MTPDAERLPVESGAVLSNHLGRRCNLDNSTAIAESAARIRAISRLLAYVMASRVKLDDALVASLSRMAARAAMFATIAEDVPC
jgi:hypothetical protein